MNVFFSVGDTVKYELEKGLKQQLLWRSRNWIAVGSTLEYTC